jgi:ABC-type sugar transport system ATPase subunit
MTARRRLRGIRDSEAKGIIIIHQELALVPLLSIAENLFLGNEVARRGVINWPDVPEDRRLAARGGPERIPRRRPWASSASASSS